MDIDQFLERELAALGSQVQPQKEKKPEAAQPEQTGHSDHPEHEEANSISDEIKQSLGKGDLTDAEESYVKLWNILAQQKLEWNAEIYNNLSYLSKQFSGLLASSYQETKRKTDNISELLGRARAALKEGKKDAAFKVYSEAEKISSSIPGIFFEEKKVIWEQMIDFYRELKSTTDNELIRRVTGLIMQLNAIVEKVNSSISSGNMIMAMSDYSKAVEIFNQVPEGFLLQKNSAGMKLLEAYKSLSIYVQISHLQKQLSVKNAMQLMREKAQIHDVKPAMAQKKPEHKKPSHKYSETIERLRSYSQ